MDASNQLQNVRNALQVAQQTLAATSESARLDAELLLAFALGRDRAWLYANPDTRLTDNEAFVFRALLGQRTEGRPIAHLTGVREFWSLELAINAHTLVPRPETELLVEKALELIPTSQAPRVLELGTGSGAVAIALATERPDCVLVATDTSAQALTLARQNAQIHCPDRIEFLQGDWYAALPAGGDKFSVIVSNPPYVGENETELTDPELAFEPAAALYSGKDGLNAITAIAKHASEWLQPQGWLVLEHGFAQREAVQTVLAAAGFESIDNAADLAGQPRVSYGQLP
jgi:release factor glutamine methyltransferase